MRLAGDGLVAVRLLHPLGQAVGDLELHVGRLVAGGEAVQEVAVLGLGLHEVGGAALEVVGVGGQQQGLAADGRVGLHLEGVGEVGTRRSYFSWASSSLPWASDSSAESRRMGSSGAPLLQPASREESGRPPPAAEGFVFIQSPAEPAHAART